MKIKFDEQSKQWVRLPSESKEGIYFSPKLFEKLINIEKIRKKGWDCIFLIDGPRRGGKSTVGLTCGKILEPNLTIANVAAGTQDAAQKISALPDGSVLLIDEGSLVFNSKESLKKEQIQLMKIIDVVGQKRLVLIVILPSFFDLNKHIAVTHSRFLIHVYTDAELNRGRFAYFGQDKKRILYEHGRKNYGSYKFPEADFIDSFTDYNPLGQEYLELKKRSLLEALKGDEEKGMLPKVRRQRDALINYIYSKRLMTQEQIADWLGNFGVRLERTMISGILAQFQEKSATVSD